MHKNKPSLNLLLLLLLNFMKNYNLKFLGNKKPAKIKTVRQIYIKKTINAYRIFSI